MRNNLNGVYLDADGRPQAGRPMAGGERQATGDDIMTAARGAAREVFPDAAPTASAHANRLCGLVDGGEW